MKTITLTISISVPDDVEVDVKTETVDSSLPKPIRVQRQADLTVPPPAPSRYAPRPWTDEEDAFVRDTTLTVAEIATVLERTLHAIGHRRYVLGINTSGKARTVVDAPAAMRRWSVEEDETLLKLAEAHLLPVKRHSLTEYAPIGEIMGRSARAIRSRYNYLRNS